MEEHPTNADLQAQIDGIHSTMTTLATKEDIADMKIFMQRLDLSVGFFTFTWNNAAKIGSVLALVFGIYLFFKVGLMGFIAFFLGNTKP